MFKVKGSPVKSASPRLNRRCPDEIHSEFHWAGIQLDKYFTGQEFKHRESCKLKAQRKNTGGKTVIASPNSVIFFAL
jgi:hypothetical protein